MVDKGVWTILCKELWNDTTHAAIVSNGNQMLLSSPLVPSGTWKRRLRQNTRPKARACGSGVAPTNQKISYGVKFLSLEKKNRVQPWKPPYLWVSFLYSDFSSRWFSRISRSSVPYFARSPHSDILTEYNGQVKHQMKSSAL